MDMKRILFALGHVARAFVLALVAACLIALLVSVGLLGDCMNPASTREAAASRLLE
jgi:hypothetical protein